MSTGDEVLPRALPRLWQLALVRTPAVRSRLLVHGGCTVLALVCSYALGVDVGWDTLDYHLYAGWSAVHNRFTQDYFAAGPQTCFGEPRGVEVPSAPPR